MRSSPTAPVMAAIAFAMVSWCARAEAQRRPSLAVVRDYDGVGGSAATPVSASPLPIVRSYEEGEPPHELAPLPPMAPWDGSPARPRATLAIVTVFDSDDAATTARGPLMLLTYEGAEVVRTVRDPAVHLLAMITDFDGATPTVMRAHVYIAYDEQGGVVRVETALPPMNVNTSAAPDDGPMVTMGGAITSSRTGAHRQGPRVRRVVRPAGTLNPTR